MPGPGNGSTLAPMGEPLGEYGGVILRDLTIFGEDYHPGDEIAGEILGQVPINNLIALRDTSMIRFLDKSGTGDNDRIEELEMVVADLALQLEVSQKIEAGLAATVKTLKADVGKLKSAATRRATAKSKK
jgi:hypothetical protein